METTPFKEHIVKEIQIELEHLGNYKVRNINNAYLLELTIGDTTPHLTDMISSVAIEVIEAYGLTLRHITVDSRGLPVVRFDYP